MPGWSPRTIAGLTVKKKFVGAIACGALSSSRLFGGLHKIQQLCASRFPWSSVTLLHMLYTPVIPFPLAFPCFSPLRFVLRW